MARKRAIDFINLESSEESEDGGTESQGFSDSQPFSQTDGDPHANVSIHVLLYLCFLTRC